MAQSMLHSCKKLKKRVTEQNFKCFVHVLFPVFCARLIIEICFHSADACILAMSCVGYARARLKTLSSLVKRDVRVKLLVRLDTRVAISNDTRLSRSLAFLDYPEERENARDLTETDHIAVSRARFS